MSRTHFDQDPRRQFWIFQRSNAIYRSQPRITTAPSLRIHQSNVVYTLDEPLDEAANFFHVRYRTAALGARRPPGTTPSPLPRAACPSARDTRKPSGVTHDRQQVFVQPEESAQQEACGVDGRVRGHGAADRD